MKQKTYYIIICAGFSMCSRYRGKLPIIVSRKPSTADLGTDDKVYSFKCDSIVGARNIIGVSRDPEKHGAKFLFSV